MKYYFIAILSIIALFSCKEEEPPVTAIQLDVNKLELKIGETYTFKVSHTPLEAKAPTYSWSASQYHPYWSKNPYDVVEIDQNGKITALKEGNTLITVQSLDVLNPASGEPFEQVCEVVIKPIEAEGITIEPKEITLKGQETVVLTASIVPANITDPKVYWTSDNLAVATVSKDNSNSLKATVTAKGAGEAIIKAYVSNQPSITAVCKITVSPTKLEGLAFKETTKTILQGEETSLEPVFTPAYATNKNIKWTSSNEAIATVDKEGKVAGIHFGECVVKAVAEDGGWEATCKIIVKPIPVQSIKFLTSNYQLEVGGEKQLEVIFTPANAGNKNVEWSSSNPIAVSVDRNGKVKGNTSGSATIVAMAEDGGATATCQVDVVEIDRLMKVYFPSAAVTIINGYYIGQIYCAIANNSSHTVRLTKFSVIETSGFNTVAETTDQSLLGELAPGKTISLGGRFNSVYEPAFCWEFEYNGRTYSTYTKYGDKSFLSQPITPVGKSNKMIELYRK